MRVRVSSFATIKYDTEACVELFFFQHDLDKLVREELVPSDMSLSDLSWIEEDNRQEAVGSGRETNLNMNCVSLMARLMKRDDKVNLHFQQTHILLYSFFRSVSGPFINVLTGV